MDKVYVYKCLYYNEDGWNCTKWYDPHIEVAIFRNKEDAITYKEDFESNQRRLNNSYTYYEGKIIGETIL